MRLGRCELVCLVLHTLPFEMDFSAITEVDMWLSRDVLDMFSCACGNGRSWRNAESKLWRRSKQNLFNRVERSTARAAAV